MSDINIDDVPADQKFIDPTTGSWMILGKYYLLSDSGSAWTFRHFSSEQEAKAWMKSPVARELFGEMNEYEVETPKFVPDTGRWDRDWDGCNCVLADDVRSWQLRDDPSYFFECQRGYQ